MPAAHYGRQRARHRQARYRCKGQYPCEAPRGRYAGVRQAGERDRAEHAAHHEGGEDPAERQIDLAAAVGTPPPPTSSPAATFASSIGSPPSPRK